MYESSGCSTSKVGGYILKNWIVNILGFLGHVSLWQTLRSAIVAWKKPQKEIKKVKLLSHVWLFATPLTVAYQALLPMEFSRQEHWSGLPFPSPGDLPDPGNEPVSPPLQADALLLGSSLGRIHGVTSGWTASAREDVRPGLIGPSLGGREREREREKESDQTGDAAKSGRVCQCFIFYHSFYTLS